MVDFRQFVKRSDLLAYFGGIRMGKVLLHVLRRSIRGDLKRLIVIPKDGAGVKELVRVGEARKR